MDSFWNYTCNKIMFYLKELCTCQYYSLKGKETDAKITNKSKLKIVL